MGRNGIYRPEKASLTEFLGDSEFESIVEHIKYMEVAKRGHSVEIKFVLKQSEAPLSFNLESNSTKASLLKLSDGATITVTRKGVQDFESGLPAYWIRDLLPPFLSERFLLINDTILHRLKTFRSPSQGQEFSMFHIKLSGSKILKVSGDQGSLENVNEFFQYKLATQEKYSLITAYYGSLYFLPSTLLDLKQDLN